MSERRRPLVRILQGELRGVIERTVYGRTYAAFKGIPYAKPPVGRLRFVDPVPVEPWTHVMDGSKFGGNCAQLNPTIGELLGSDDCLYLNVYTRHGAAERRTDDDRAPTPPRPVMFWIHGGAFAYGSGDHLLYGADYLIEKDVVLVTINYRLGVLGFLNLEDDEASGNQGLKDQVLALKWVRDNINEFGGDPRNVTIFGESAGGASVHYLTLSPLAEGLYHKAISQSGVALNPWAHERGSQKEHARAMAAMLGREIRDSKMLVDFLRGIDAQRLVEIDKRTRDASAGGLRRLLFVPTVDSHSKSPFLAVAPQIAARSGVKVPYLIGNTSHEGIAFLAGVPNDESEILNKHFNRALAPNVMDILKAKSMTVADLKEMYFGEKSSSRDARYNFMQMHSDLQFICGIHEVARIQSSTNVSPTYLYEFSYEGEISLMKTAFGLDMPGTCHGDELVYLLYPKIMENFGIAPPEPASTGHLMIQRLTQMWSDFARTGNPTPKVTESVPLIWNPVTNGRDMQVLNIDKDLRMKRVSNINGRFVKRSKSKL